MDATIPQQAWCTRWGQPHKDGDICSRCGYVKEITHSGRAIVMDPSDGYIYVRCYKRHLVERIPKEEWETHWLHDKVFDPKFNIECSIEN